jgi:hypothetical protein
MFAAWVFMFAAQQMYHEDAEDSSGSCRSGAADEYVTN